jgi:hypothetical protein
MKSKVAYLSVGRLPQGKNPQSTLSVLVEGSPQFGGQVPPRIYSGLLQN